MHRNLVVPFALVAILSACTVEQPAAQDGEADQPAPAAAEPVKAAPDENAIQPVDSGEAGPPASGASNPAMQWGLNASPEGAKLTYGEPRTDNLALMLRCASGGDVILSFNRSGEAAEDPAERIVLRSGQASRNVPSETESSELGGVIVEARAPASSAPLERFRGGQPLRLEWGEETIEVPAADTSVAGRFFDLCRE